MVMTSLEMDAALKVWFSCTICTNERSTPQAHIHIKYSCVSGKQQHLNTKKGTEMLNAVMNTVFYFL